MDGLKLISFHILLQYYMLAVRKINATTSREGTAFKKHSKSQINVHFENNSIQFVELSCDYLVIWCLIAYPTYVSKIWSEDSIT